METSLLITIILGAITVIATVAVPIALSRKENPKRELTYAVRSERLLGRSAAGLGLVVTHDGKELENPHLVTIGVISTGRADIGSDRFDDRRPIRFTVSVPVVADLDEPEDSDGKPCVRFNGTDTYEVKPVLIRKTDRFYCRFLTEGRPEIEMVSPLRDIEVKSESDYLKQKRRRSSRWYMSTLFVGAVGVAAIAVVLVLLFPMADVAPDDVLGSVFNDLPLFVVAAVGGTIVFSIADLVSARNRNRSVDLFAPPIE